MKNIWILMFTVFALFSASPVSAADVTVDPWFVEGMNQPEMVLEPGTTSYCNKDFMVENLGNQTAEVRVIRDNGDNYEHDLLAPGAKVRYGLQDRSIFATAGSWGHRTEEARIVNATSGDAKIRVICK